MEKLMWITDYSTGDMQLINNEIILTRIPADAVKYARVDTGSKPNYIDQLKSHLQKHYENVLYS